jgi:hypothetical protein
MFCVFFVFGGVLNILPFRVKDISSDVSEFQISLLYLGYGMGILVSLNAKRIIKFFKNEINTILVGLVFFLFITNKYNSGNKPADVVHWHGAAPDSGFTHIAINTKVHLGATQWYEPVSDEEYTNQ